MTACPRSHCALHYSKVFSLWDCRLYREVPTLGLSHGWTRLSLRTIAWIERSLLWDIEDVGQPPSESPFMATRKERRRDALTHRWLMASFWAHERKFSQTPILRRKTLCRRIPTVDSSRNGYARATSLRLRLVARAHLENKSRTCTAGCARARAATETPRYRTFDPRTPWPGPINLCHCLTAVNHLSRHGPEHHRILGRFEDVSRFHVARVSPGTWETILAERPSTAEARAFLESMSNPPGGPHPLPGRSRAPASMPSTGILERLGHRPQQQGRRPAPVQSRHQPGCKIWLMVHATIPRTSRTSSVDVGRRATAGRRFVTSTCSYRRAR
jgi:hypothetical protein